MLTDEQKLKAVEVYLGWKIDTLEEAIEALNQIYWVVVEGKYKPESEKQ